MSDTTGVERGSLAILSAGAAALARAADLDTALAVVVEASAFTTFSEDEQHAIAASAARYGEFLGMPAVLS